MFQMTIYSPVDGEEHLYALKPEDVDKAVMALTAMMEVGAWFKIERVS